jgi:hypothetical protein
MVYIQDVEQAYESWVMARRAEWETALVVKQLTRKFDGLCPLLLCRSPVSLRGLGS